MQLLNFSTESEFTLKRALEMTRSRLASSAIQCFDPALHAKQILQFILGYSPANIFARPDRVLTVVEEAKLERFLRRRVDGEPFQYLVGHEWFWECPFEVGPGVLIPRKDTEVLVEAILNRMDASPKKVIELGAGSGNIGISVLRSRKNWQWDGYEKNPESLKYLRTNVTGLLGVPHHYRIVHDDFFTADAVAEYDLVVSNPPYIVTKEIETLSLEVRNEPHLALDGGASGLEVVGRFFESALRLLKSGGFVMSELGAGQSSECRQLLSPQWQEIEILRDSAGIDRVLVARKGS
jgi:release factor glutamine methyltransferase